MKAYIDNEFDYCHVPIKTKSEKKDYAGIVAIIFTFFLIVIVTALTIYTFIEIAYGQNYAFDPLLTKCVLHNDEHIIILDLTCDQKIDVVVWYANKGYEIKAILQTIMFLQK